MNTDKFISWLNAVADDVAHADVSIGFHLDEIIGDEVLKDIKGESLLFYGQSLVKISDVFMRERGVVVSHCVFCIPIEESLELGHWSGDVSMLGDSSEPPALYFMKTECVFPEDEEEYRMPLICDDAQVNMIYRSSRSREYIANNWEFSNAIFLIVKSIGVHRD